MMTEQLYIKNFASFAEATVELARMNILIGPQASGKSVCVKLFFFFKEIISDLPIDVARFQTKVELRKRHKETFQKYFPPASWGRQVFTIRYSCGNFWVTITRRGNESRTINISYSPHYDQLLKSGTKMMREQEASQFDEALIGRWDVNGFIREFDEVIAQDLGNTITNINYFIPAGRSFFSVIQRGVFSLLSRDIEIDPFLAEFGRIYQKARDAYIDPFIEENAHTNKINEYVSQLLCGSYERNKDKDYIRAEDGRLIPLEVSSSGQQEVLPLAITLAKMSQGGETEYSTIIIEEPEAHLFPVAQRNMVHLFSAVSDLWSDDAYGQYLITTHSPYILSALNNLMYGGKIISEYPDKEQQVLAVLNEAVLINPAQVRAYSVNGGTVTPIIDPETGLVKASVLDSVSNELAGEFEALVDIEFEE